MAIFEQEFTLGDQSFTFRVPSAKDMILMDQEALALRKGESEGLSSAIVYSQSIAFLNRIVVKPEKTDFGDLPAHVVDALSNEVAKWLQTFRTDVAGK